MKENTLKNFLQEHDIYLLGPMGVGKTTFINNLRQLTEVNYVSIGEITRRSLLGESPDSLFVDREKGRIPLVAVQKIISPYLNSRSSYILDGVPRHADEAEWIKAHIKTRPFKAVLLTLYANDALLRERIHKRALNSGRFDPTERIERRHQVYKNNYETIMNILEPVLVKSIELDTSNLSSKEVLQEFCNIIVKE